MTISDKKNKIRYILGCNAALNCKTCTATECTSCDDGDNVLEPLFIKAADDTWPKRCVTQSECDMSQPYFWDDSAKKCDGMKVIKQ